MPTSSGHIPVMLEETLQGLNVQPGGRYIDCTVGGGGHSESILERSAPGGQLLGLDADPQALEIARNRLAPHKDSVLLVNENFSNLQAVCLKYDFLPVHGIVFDLGLSSLQLSPTGRGFSFQHDAPLDMRFSPEQQVTAADIVNTYSAEELAHILRDYGEESLSRQIASRIVKQRPIETSSQLAHIIEEAAGRRGRIHPATRTFQALRIAVNQELKSLEMALHQAVDMLGYEGRLAVISYHSLEDRIVKQFMQRESKKCICPPDVPTCICRHKASLRMINKKVIIPTPEEIRRNPRSRSAKLRIAERVIEHEEGVGAVGEDPSLYMTLDGSGWRRPAMLEKIRMVFSMS